MAEPLSKKLIKRCKDLFAVLCALCTFALFIPALAQANSAPASISISQDGRFVAFISETDDLVTNDSNGVADVFVRDRMANTIERVSLSSTGEQSDAPASQVVISADGRFVTFVSAADSLVPDDAVGFEDVYVHDRLTGITERASVNDRGQRGDGNSSDPDISTDGRYVAFRSEAKNLVLDDSNGVADVFIRDRLTGHTIRASVSSREAESNFPSGGTLAISGDGRTVAFSSEGATLAIAISNEPRIYLYNRVLAQIEYLNLPVDDNARVLEQLALSTSANTLAALSQMDEQHYETLVYQKSDGAYQIIFSFETTSPTAPQISLSADGPALAIAAPGQGIFYVDLTSGAMQTVPAEVPPDRVAISADGQTLAISAEGQAITQNIGEAALGFTLSGQVTDATGQPLALVTIKTSGGDSTRTDGSGYFFFSGIPPGVTELIPAKDGFTFEPESRSIEVTADANGLHFTAAHGKVLEEARLDLGMPYSEARGESGPYHGYAAGYCTDLVLDAYTWGVEYNIQFALEQDYRAHPEHFYRWRDARDAHDMWRYFSYTGQMLPHAAPYQPGDIVFFDWSEDGEIDHVAIVSEVTPQNQPRNLYDATGVIASNPGGRAAELPWEDFHERTVRGHARWSGAYQPVIPTMPGGEYLQVAVGASQISLRMTDPQGGQLARETRQIAGASFFSLGWEQNLSVFAPLEIGTRYTVEISNLSEVETPYIFIAHTTQEGLVTERVEFEGILAPEEVYTLVLELSRGEDETLTLKIVDD